MPRITNDLEVTLSQRITRADGTVEDLGVVASTRDGSITVHKQPTSWLRRLLKGKS